MSPETSPQPSSEDSASSGSLQADPNNEHYHVLPELSDSGDFHNIKSESESQPENEATLLDLRDTLYAEFHGRYSNSVTVHRSSEMPSIQVNSGKVVKLAGYISPMALSLAEELKKAEREEKWQCTSRTCQDNPWAWGTSVVMSIAAVGLLLGILIPVLEVTEPYAFSIANETYYPQGDIIVERQTSLLALLLNLIIEGGNFSAAAVGIAIAISIVLRMSRQPTIEYAELPVKAAQDEESHDEEDQYDERSSLLAHCRVKVSCDHSSLPYVKWKGQYWLIRLQDIIPQASHLHGQVPGHSFYQPTSPQQTQLQGLKQAGKGLMGVLRRIELNRLAHSERPAKRGSQVIKREAQLQSHLMLLHNALPSAERAVSRGDSVDNGNLFAAARAVAENLKLLLDVAPDESDERLRDELYDAAEQFAYQLEGFQVAQGIAEDERSNDSYSDGGSESPSSSVKPRRKGMVHPLSTHQGEGRDGRSDGGTLRRHRELEETQAKRATRQLNRILTNFDLELNVSRSLSSSS